MGDSSVDSRRRLCGDVAASGLLVLAVASVVLFDRLAVTAVEPPVDVVFLLDEGRSMSALVDAMRADCLEKAKKLRHSGMDCRFAVVPFGCADDPAFSEVPLTGNPDAFRRQFENPPASSVSAPLRSGIDAINRALELPFRSESSVFFFMISPQPVTPGDSLESVAHRIQQHGITAIIQAESSQRDTCRVLLNNGGRFFSFEGKDMTPPGADAGSDASAPVVSLLSASSHTASGDEDAVSMLAANGLYSARTRPDRDRWIQDLGGTEESEAAVKAGLDWLARHQSADGSWSDQSLCDGSACSSLNYNAPTAQTGLAILAFQAGGHYAFNEQQYSSQVRRGLDWIVERQKADGSLFDRHTWYEHGIATFALAEACAVARSECYVPAPRYTHAARRAVAFMEEHQYAQGGWRYQHNSRGKGDTSVTGWQMLALKSAMEAGIPPGSETLERVLKFFATLQDPETGHTGYTSRGFHSDLTTAVGLVVDRFFVKNGKSPLVSNAARYFRERAAMLGPSGDFYTLYNATLAMFLAGGDAWAEWNASVRDAVIERQETEGCRRGSWPGRYGRTLATAWAVLTLEVYYRYVPGDEVQKTVREKEPAGEEQNE